MTRRSRCSASDSSRPCVHSFCDRDADADLAREGRRVRGQVLRGAARDAPRGLRPRRGRRTCSSGSTRPTTPPSTASTTSARSSSRSTSSLRSSTTRATSARSRRRTRSTTSSRWAARRCSRSRSRRFRRSCRPRCSARSWRARDEVVRAAGAILAGGHTIRDDEPKYGLAVVGTVHPDGIWPKSGARPGDALFLTKPLGTGLVLQAQRDGRAPDGALEAAVDGDADAQPRRGRGAAAVRAERRHRRDRLRAARARARDGLAQRRAHRARRRRAARAARRARARRGRGPHRRRPAQPRVRRAARRERRGDAVGGARLRPADGRRAARLAARRQGAPCSTATFARPRLALYRIGRVDRRLGRRAR